MINPETPSLVKINGEWMIMSKYCLLKIDIFHEDGNFIWIRLDPEDTIVKAERNGVEMFETLRACMRYQRLFNKAAVHFDMYEAPEIRKRFNPGRHEGRVIEGWFRARSMAWEEVLHNDDWENRRMTLELDLRDLWATPTEGSTFDWRHLMSAEGIEELGKAHLTYTDGLKTGAVDRNRIVHILLTGLAWWYDSLVELADQWKINEALEGDGILYKTVLYTDEPAIYRGMPTLTVKTTEVGLTVSLSELDWIRSEWYPRHNTTRDGMSFSDESSYIKKLAPRLLARICSDLKDCMEEIKFLKEEI